MSSNNNVTQYITAECPTCKTPLSLAMPPIVMFQHMLCSVISIPHTKGITCSGCGQYYAPILQGCQVMMNLAPAVKPELPEDNKILPFTNPIPKNILGH